MAQMLATEIANASAVIASQRTMSGPRLDADAMEAFVSNSIIQMIGALPQGMSYAHARLALNALQASVFKDAEKLG